MSIKTNVNVKPLSVPTSNNTTQISTVKINNASSTQDIKTINPTKQTEDVNLDESIKTETDPTTGNQIECHYEDDSGLWKYRIERDASGNIVKMSYFNNTNDGYEITTLDKDYKELSTKTYDENWTVLTSKETEYDENGKVISITTKTSLSAGLYQKTITDADGNIINSSIDYSNYQYTNVTTNGKTNLTKISGNSLESILGEEKISEINKKITEGVKNCTTNGEKVAAASSILISSLAEEGYFLPYYLSGGHGNISAGADPTLGSKTSTTGLTTKRNVKSFDCSGIVNWSIKTALGVTDNNWSFEGGSTNTYMNYGVKTSKENATAGDVFVKDSHMFMVADTYTDSSGELHAICVESHADGWICDNTAQATDGVELVDYTVSKISNSYTLYDMDSYYDNLFN